MNSPTIRSATPDDAEALLEIYSPFVLNTPISFELDVPSVEEFRQRIAGVLERWAWLVAERDGEVVGYAYGGKHRDRRAYQWSFEPSVYVRASDQGRGVGRLLYDALFTQLAALGYCNAYAGITLPNEASIALHRRCGFTPVGIFRSVGRKFGAWHDVSWWHLSIRDAPPGE